MEPKQIPEIYLPKEFTPTVEFNDGSSLNATAGYNAVSDDLWIWLSDPMSFEDAVRWFSNNPSKTDTIVVNTSLMERMTYDHYTILMDIQEGTEGTKNIRLKR